MVCKMQGLASQAVPVANCDSVEDSSEAAHRRNTLPSLAWSDWLLCTNSRAGVIRLRVVSDSAHVNSSLTQLHGRRAGS